MTSGKVRSPVAFDFPVADGSVLIYVPHMPVECPFGSDMDVKTVPSGDFKECSSRDPFPVQEFLFLFIEQPLMLLFCALPPHSPPAPCVSVPASFCMPHGLASRVRCQVREPRTRGRRST